MEENGPKSNLAGIGTLITKYAKPNRDIRRTRATERGELLTYFTSQINRERIGSGYKAVTIRYVAYKLSGIPTSDLYFIQKQCDLAASRGYSWSRCFFGSLKIKQNTYEANKEGDNGV